VAYPAGHRRPPGQRRVSAGVRSVEGEARKVACRVEWAGGRRGNLTGGRRLEAG